ncbi:MAG TPA: hypothetical protein GX523_16995 [Desulfitobacterium dehalogenans]|uniref:Uncharacterized protein n=1 Tax=Desulfitobacterium dehalogenans TaxID=36854 RepID=A0A7C7DCD9_9FIRM|nr:hypothetical protein [Desulfitobacterium dehalogenans]
MQLQVGVYKYVYSAMVFILIGVFILTACSELFNRPIYGSQPFIVDTSTGKEETAYPLQTPDGPAEIEQKPILKLLTSDRKEKIEIFDGQLADGRKIFISSGYQWRSEQWNWVHSGQAAYELSTPVKAMSVSQFGVLELIDLEIMTIEYETEKDKKQLSIMEVDDRRFVAYLTDPGHRDYYQIRGLSKSGEILWQLFDDGYW